jgi:hypothetical protein
VAPEQTAWNKRMLSVAIMRFVAIACIGIAVYSAPWGMLASGERIAEGLEGHRWRKSVAKPYGR